MQRAVVGVRGDGVGVHDAEVCELQRDAEEQKSESGRGVSPYPRQLQAGDKDDERIKKVERGINVAGDVKNGSGENQVSKNLKARLYLDVLPYSYEEDLDQGNGVPKQDDRDETRNRHIAGGKPGNSQLNAQQKGDDDDADLDEPT